MKRNKNNAAAQLDMFAAPAPAQTVETAKVIEQPAPAPVYQLEAPKSPAKLFIDKAPVKQPKAPKKPAKAAPVKPAKLAPAKPVNKRVFELNAAQKAIESDLFLRGENLPNSWGFTFVTISKDAENIYYSFKTPAAYEFNGRIDLVFSIASKSYGIMLMKGNKLVKKFLDVKPVKLAMLIHNEIEFKDLKSYREKTDTNI